MVYQYLCPRHQQQVAVNPCAAFNWWLKSSALAEQRFAARDFTAARIFSGTAFEIALARLLMSQECVTACDAQGDECAQRLAKSSRLRIRVLTQLGLLDEVEECLRATHQALAMVDAAGRMPVKSLLREFSQRARALLQMLGRAEEVLVPSARLN